MGNYCMKLYEKLQPTETCQYCKKNKIIGGKETGFIITTQGCRTCRIKNKYLFKPVSIIKVPINNLGRKPSYNRIFDPDPFHNVSNKKVTGRYY
tara:strand:- start:595 stop:876 length:282 start_codon:yes stop_codon:yes gene_type:complete